MCVYLNVCERIYCIYTHTCARAHTLSHTYLYMVHVYRMGKVCVAMATIFFLLMGAPMDAGGN